MRKVVLFAAIAAAVVLLSTEIASARGCRSSCGSSCYSGCGSRCYSSYGSCYYISYGCGSYGYCGCSSGYCGLGGMSGVPYSAAPSLSSATLVVELPAEATLTVDGAATAQKTAVRTFSTPALDAGKDYFYTLTATVERGGKMETVTKKVTVKAGETTRVALEPTTEAVAAK
jgi:uncharacterized protein (TIGR03000 family)